MKNLQKTYFNDDDLVHQTRTIKTAWYLTDIEGFDTQVTIKSINLPNATIQHKNGATQTVPVKNLKGHLWCMRKSKRY